MISFRLESRTLATFLSAEFGFLGVMVLTTVATPRFCGLKVTVDLLREALNDERRAAALTFFETFFRPFLTN